jgi:RimJ/RimL family protein N-acetyltransferase
VTNRKSASILLGVSYSDWNSLVFGPAEKGELPSALRLVFAHSDGPQQARQIAAAIEEIERSGENESVPLVARRAGTMVAAIWVQIQPGAIASLWPPGLIAGEPAATALALIDLAAAKAHAAGAQFLQSLLETDADAEAKWLGHCGFRHCTDLLYLVSPRTAGPDAQPSNLLRFEACRDLPDRMARLAAIVQQTYEKTQDCPFVHGLRSIDDVLAGYKAVGKYDGSLWFLVVGTGPGECQRDVGCLLLTEYPAEKNRELIYFGVVPAARGAGLGLEIVRHAQWLTRHSTAERLVLAVDAANSPAIAVYAAAGFEAWDRRSVFLRSA